MTSSTKSKSTIARRLGLGGAAVGAGLALAVLTAPAASAEVTGVTVSPGISFGATIATGPNVKPKNSPSTIPKTAAKKTFPGLLFRPAFRKLLF